MYRNLTIPFIKTIPLTPGLKTNTLTLLFHYNVEVRYALQLHHLSRKILSGYESPLLSKFGNIGENCMF